MAWLRVSDSAGNNPIVLEPLTDPTVPPVMDTYLWANAICGVVLRCATMAAGYPRSYHVTDATIASVAGPQWRTVAEAAERAGYWSRDGERGWLLRDDSEHFVHIRRGEEIDWERARKADAANDNLVVPVRLRDGDGCRYCPKLVIWRDNVSKRGGTYDHRVPGRQARTPEDLRVACRGCNGQRGDDPNADERVPPRPVPATPFYGAKTVAFLAERGVTVPESAPQRPGAKPDHAQRPGTLPDTAHRDLATSGAPRPGDPAPGRTTPTSDRASSAITPVSALLNVDALADPANRRTAKVQSPGRDGTDREGSGSGRDGDRHPPPTRNRRARRGKDHRRRS